MFNIDLDEKWIAEQLLEIKKRVPEIIEERLKHTARGIIQDLVVQAVKEELQKPEYRDRLGKIAKEILLRKNADQLIQTFMERRY